MPDDPIFEDEFEGPDEQDPPIILSGEGDTEGVNDMADTPFDGGVYCDFSSTVANITKGKDILLCLFSKDGEDLLALGGQQSFSLEMSMDSSDATTKDTRGGWGAEIPTVTTYTLSTEGLTSKGDQSQRELLAALVAKSLLCFKVVEEVLEQDGTYSYEPIYGGLAYATSYTDEAPHDDMRSYSIEFSGVGKLWIADIATAEEIAEATAAPSNRGSDPEPVTP